MTFSYVKTYELFDMYVSVFIRKKIYFKRKFGEKADIFQQIENASRWKLSMIEIFDIPIYAHTNINKRKYEHK